MWGSQGVRRFFPEESKDDYAWDWAAGLQQLLPLPKLADAEPGGGGGGIPVNLAPPISGVAQQPSWEEEWVRLPNFLFGLIGVPSSYSLLPSLPSSHSNWAAAART